MSNILRLGVNVDHVATVRQARGTPYPDPVEAGLLAAASGADSITIHLREDRRHIQDHDLRSMLASSTVPVNLEMAVTDEMIALACELRPPLVCLVPERREELTTEGGLDVAGQQRKVGAACARLAEAGIEVALFIDADPRQLDAARAVQAPQLEIHTGRYCELDAGPQIRELDRIRRFARDAHAAGLEVHAGHGLHSGNVAPIAAIPEIVELNIGHSLIARALFVGLPAAIAEILLAMRVARGGGAA